MKNERSLDKKMIGEALADAASIIFHPEMLPWFLTFRMTNASPPSPKVWAESMAKGYLKHSDGQACIDLCWKSSIASLRNFDPVQGLSGFLKGGKPIDPSVADKLVAAKKILLENPDDYRWLGLVYFCYSRMISVSSKKGFDENEWGDATLLLIMVEKVFSAGKGEDFMWAISGDLGSLYQSKTHLQHLIAKNVGVGLATMAAIAPDAKFFKGMKVS